MTLMRNEEQVMLQDQVRSLCEEHANADHLRSLISAEKQWCPDLWSKMAELGLQAASIPEEFGGVGLGVQELCVIVEELGRSVAPVPFFSSACMATEAIKLAATQDQQQKWLPELAAGSKIATLAHATGSGSPLDSYSGVTVVDGKMNGSKSPVPDLLIADWLLVIAAQNNEPVIALVDLKAANHTVSALSGFDELRGHGSVHFEDTPCEVLGGFKGVQLIKELFCRIATICAFEQVGGAEAALLMARDYALDRHVFGRQLASYQAVKHNLANILVSIELTRSNALWAASAIESNSDERFLAASTARVGAIPMYEIAGRENLQIHGGIGFTWEANCHFHYRRSRLLSQNIGDAGVWRHLLVKELKESAA